MDHRVTQCPRCGTSFRVTEAHLAVAAGAVRCGSCLHIFSARDHWADEQEKKAAPAARTTPGTNRPAPQAIDDDALIDDDSPLFDDDDDEEDEKPKGGSIFNPMDEDFGDFKIDGPEKFSDPFMELNSWEEDPGPAFGAGARGTAPEPIEEVDEAWTKHLLEDDARDDSIIQSAPARSSIFEDYGDVLEQVPESPEHSDEAFEIEEEFLDIPDLHPASASARSSEEIDDDAAPDIESIDLSMTPLHADGRIGMGSDGASPFSGFEAEPLQLHQFVHEPRWPKVAWGAGLALALALAVGQYLYFNFATLARGDLRPWLAQACSVFNCNLPTQSDIAQIRTSSLIVRSHPTHHGALAVDAIITNQAPFAQPYPLLQLQFTDLNGAPVAGRQFSPGEYLGGELSGSRLMPVQQPVHIALELVDPGPRAVNYLLTVAATPASP